MFDLDAYLERIGLGDRPGLSRLHRAHVESIPFENLDPHRGVPVSLAIDDLQRKLVEGRRGGYCFEQNLLFKAALEALGHRVEPLLARVRIGAAPGALRPRTHLVLRVHAEGAVWHADVGFGNGTLREPLPFGPDGIYDQLGWRFRVVAEGDRYVLQTIEETEWIDLYAFIPEPVPFVDLETSNWYTATHPRSPFVTGLNVSIQRRDGTRTSLSDWTGLSLVNETPRARTVTPVASADLPRLLADEFGLSGFAVNGDGRVIRAGDREHRGGDPGQRGGDPEHRGGDREHRAPD
jgi:N-hydroxyarylamine O-acetyltransferase